VVTRWYRPPELLLGARQYAGEIDLWGIGFVIFLVAILTLGFATAIHSCVLAEMFTRRPILPGNSDLDQVEKIWQLCGTPNQHTWPNFDALPGCEGVKRFSAHSRKVKQTYERLVISCPCSLAAGGLTNLDDNKYCPILVLARRPVTCSINC
jgi:serine/threonine-protein kinase BUR1